METDVLIVGAGPTGLMTANQLARRGVRVVIVDRHPGPAVQTRALGVHARTLEVYSGLKIADRAVALGKPATGANVWSRGRHAARIPLSYAGADLTPFPYILVLGQDDNERILGAHLNEQGVTVRWNTELVGIEQRPGSVLAKLANGSQELAIETRWVAGCDGAHSAVRQLNGIDFPGAPYEHVFFVADVEAVGSMVPDEVNIYFWKDGFHLFFPMRGTDHWRVVGILPEELRGDRVVTFEDVIPSVHALTGPQLVFKHCTWFSTYRIHHRRASRFRAGRCFVLGDAAHIHSPVGAQGMNTGLQDAYNLAWKLAAVIKDGADPTLLDSYALEREPVADRLLATTDRAFRVAVSNSWLAGLFRTQIPARAAAFVMRRPGIQRVAFKTVAQLAIHYRGSSLSQSTGAWPNEAPQAGDRFPWMTLQRQTDGPIEDLFDLRDDSRWCFVSFATATPTASKVLSVVAPSLQEFSFPATAHNDQVLRRAGIPPTSHFLIRPDGHVGLRSRRFDASEIEQYLRSIGIATNR